MNFVLLNTKKNKTYTLSLDNPLYFIAFSIGALLIVASCMGLAYYKGIQQSPEQYVSEWQNVIAAQKKELVHLRESSQSEINALSNQLGKLQAHVARMDALGERLVIMANIDSGEFNFKAAPAVGGPDADSSITQNNLDDIETSISKLDQTLFDRSVQLSVLEKVISNKNLNKEVYPAGKPAEKAWLSSGYGWRTNPFGGNKQFHKGIDFAGKEGSAVLSVGAGVVTWSGRRFGYGNLVEITHGNGYVTRYGHNKENVVKEGETVKKGQKIANMGSTGRSTGPHVHFEVIRDGQRIDPAKFISMQTR